MKPLIQTAKAVWLVRPAVFYGNEQTQSSNAFQDVEVQDKTILNELVQNEFDSFCKSLTSAEIRFFVNENKNTNAPDAIFPNNWISFHHDGTVIIYPMMAINRRAEKDLSLLENIKSVYHIYTIHDLSELEHENKFLEGTGSIVFDHVNRIAFACIGVRTDLSAFEYLTNKLGYEPYPFTCNDRNDFPIYHTNVMLSIGETYVIVCSASIADRNQRDKLMLKLKESGRVIIDITFDQLHLFAGNMLQVMNQKEELITVISSTAFDSLTDIQLTILLDHTRLLRVEIPMIERAGGGSVRCMMAELFFAGKIINLENGTYYIFSRS